jgi:hypothetical protein
LAFEFARRHLCMGDPALGFSEKQAKSQKQSSEF